MRRVRVRNESSRHRTVSVEFVAAAAGLSTRVAYNKQRTRCSLAQTVHREHSVAAAGNVSREYAPAKLCHARPYASHQTVRRDSLALPRLCCLNKQPLKPLNAMQCDRRDIRSLIIRRCSFIQIQIATDNTGLRLLSTVNSRLVTFALSAPYKYSYLLTYLHTYITSFSCILGDDVASLLFNISHSLYCK